MHPWQHFVAQAHSVNSGHLLGDIDGCWGRGESLRAAQAIAEAVDAADGSLDDDAIIAVHLPRDRRYLAALFAIWLRGNTVLPLNVDWPPAHIHRVISHAGAAAVISSDDAVLFDAAGAAVIKLPCASELPGLTQPSAAKLALWAENRSLEDRAYVIYTSGSTGDAKGVCISQAAFSRYIEWTLSYWPAVTYQALLITAELTFDLSLGDIAFALAHDVEIHVSPDPGNLFAHAQLLGTRQVDVLYSVPSTLSRLLSLCEARHDISLEGIRLVVTGGDVLSPALVEKAVRMIPGAQFHNVYGPTELTINCVATRVDDRLEGIRKRGQVPIGWPFAHLDSLLYPERPGEAPGWTQGELLVSGEQVMQGYLHDPERTEAALVQLHGNRYYRTGDMVSRSPDGCYYLQGRIDSLVKISGYRISPFTIDNLLLEGEDVRECCTVVVREPDCPPRLVAFAVVGGETTAEDLLSACRTSLPSYLCPHQVFLLDALPLGSSGKHDKQKLEHLAASRLESE